jgi:hypothetical protein
MEALYAEFAEFLETHSSNKEALAKFSTTPICEVVVLIKQYLTTYQSISSILKGIIANELGISCFDTVGLTKLDYFLDQFNKLSHVKLQ